MTDCHGLSVPIKERLRTGCIDELAYDAEDYTSHERLSSLVAGIDP